jgi:hypothetical protein
MVNETWVPCLNTCLIQVIKLYCIQLYWGHLAMGWNQSQHSSKEKAITWNQDNNSEWKQHELTFKKNLIACWSSTKHTSSSFHRKVTYSHWYRYSWKKNCSLDGNQQSYTCCLLFPLVTNASSSLNEKEYGDNKI